ncbi:glycosyltransferase [Candidatus Roizmanbacteria bacterium]|nr:glycosyltransferase [Candidatus Roizmanbacteria bacterium]
MRRVSIIMGIYNCAATLSEALDSILAQSFSDWELILCDDCSTDSSLEIAQSYKKKFPQKIMVIRNAKNSKLAYTLNHCLRYATGEYIARMDGDDISLPQRLQKQVDFLDANPDYAVVSTAMIVFDEKGNKAVRRKIECPDKYSLAANPCFDHATIMMRKTAFEKLGGYIVSRRTERGQDYDLWFRFFATGYKGYNMQEPLYKVRENTSTFSRRTLTSRLYIALTMLIGYRLLRYPLKYYVYILKQIVAGLTPVSVLKFYRKHQDKKSLCVD